MIILDLASFIGPYSEISGANPFKIEGKMRKQGVAIQSFVRCYEKASGALIRQTISDKDGNYSFHGLSRNRKYFIVSHDPLTQYNAVVQDNVVPK